MPLKWAFNSATVMPTPWDAEFALWRRFGWTAVEVWYDKIVARLERGGSGEELGRHITRGGHRPSRHVRRSRLDPHGRTRPAGRT